MSTIHMKMVMQPAVETLCVSDILHLGQRTGSNIMFVTGMFCGLFTSGNDMYNMDNRSYKKLIMHWNINVIVTSLVTGIHIYVSACVLVFIKLKEHVSEWYPEKIPSSPRMRHCSQL